MNNTFHQRTNKIFFSKLKNMRFFIFFRFFSKNFFVQKNIFQFLFFQDSSVKNAEKLVKKTSLERIVPKIVSVRTAEFAITSMERALVLEDSSASIV